MFRLTRLLFSVSFALAGALWPQGRLRRGPQPFISLNDPVIALTCGRVIGGSGAPARANQTVVLDHGRILAAGDQGNVELLVEAGFKAEEAIRIYTANAALYLGKADRIGAIAPGKRADVVIVSGDPSTRLAAIENVKYVFEDGIAFDPPTLMDSVRRTVGIH